MRLLSNADIEQLLTPMAVLSSVEQAARALRDGRAIVPARQHIEWNDNTLLMMPAVSNEMLGVKLVSVHPGNGTRNLPAIHGLMILASAETGVPLAMMSAGALTAQRTGAVGALGVKHMTPAHTHLLGIVGIGAQGIWQAIFACAVRPIRVIHFLARSDASADRFVSLVSARVRGVSFVRCTDVREVVGKSELVITATTSSTPVLPDDATILAGKHFISVGSFKPDMQELPLSVFGLAGHLVIDSESARHETGDVLRPVQQGVLAESDVFHIAELVTGQRTVNCEDTTVYKSVGMALYDLFVARALYEEACRGQVGKEFAL